MKKKFAFQDPHRTNANEERFLEEAIGREVKRFREKLGLTISELARAADMSAGMLSKIENGATSPSLSSLQALSKSLQVPFTAFFKSYEEIKDATFVKSGQGLTIERRGTRAGHQYQLLGHSTHGPVMVEPYLITLKSESDVFPTFQHPGME
ncbi:MAG: helix-turn-helix transcriptional regulator, partial [Aestuariivirga sp.]